MRIEHGTYKDIAIAWSTITLPLKAGTPIDKDGKIANSGDAIGLVPETYNLATTEMVLPDKLYILVGGDVWLAEVEAESGLTINTGTIKALEGINFYDDNNAALTHGKSMVCPVEEDDDEEITIGVSYNTLKNAVLNGQPVFISYASGDATVYETLISLSEEEDTSYSATFTSQTFAATDPDDALELQDIS